MKRHTIQVYRSRDCWMTKHSNPYIRELFGTDTIPTPRRSCALADDVLEAIKRLNPDCDVYLVSSPKGWEFIEY